MRISLKNIAVFSIFAASFIAQPALADGNVRCNSGPQKDWKSLADLRKKAWIEGWSVQKAQIAEDCYEIYARNETGQAIEAFFHPVTLKKLLVYRRGQIIYQTPEYSALAKK